MIRKLFLSVSFCCSISVTSFAQESDWLEKGWEDFNNMRFDSAIQSFNRALLKTPTEPKAYKYRGLVYLRLKKFKQAISDFNQSLRFGNDSTEIMWLRAETFTYLNKPDSAINDIHFLLARSIDIEEKATLLALNGKILFHANRLDESKKVTQEALQLNPANETALKNRLLLISKTDELPKVLEEAQNFTKLFPNDPVGYYFLGVCYLYKNQPNMAIESLEQAKDKYEGDPVITSLLAIVYSISGDNEKAMIYAQTAIKEDENYFEGYLARGYVLLNTFKYKEAIYDLNHAIRLFPNDSRAYHFRGKCYYGLKDYKRAEIDLKKCIEIDQKVDDAYVFLGYIYKEWKMKSKACESWKKALALGALDIEEEMVLYCK